MPSPSLPLTPLTHTAQDFVHQRERVYFDATNFTNTSNATFGNTADPDFLRAVVPYPDHLPNITEEDRGGDETRVFSHSAAGLRTTVLEVRTNGELTKYRLLFNGSYFMFRFYEQRLDGMPIIGLAGRCQDHGFSHELPSYGT